MQCKKVAVSREQLLDPLAAEWGNVSGESIKMDATPLANQPSEYIKASRDEKQVGKVRSLMVQAAHNGTDVFFRLSWEDSNENMEITDNNVFPDGCGVLLPVNGGDPPIDEMGSKDAPVNAWFWRADFKDSAAKNTIAQGLGTTQSTEKCAIKARGAWGNGAWAVVFARPIAVDDQKNNAQLAVGKTAKVAFAVWEGSNGERAGVKSFSKEWRELLLEA